MCFFQSNRWPFILNSFYYIWGRKQRRCKGQHTVTTTTLQKLHTGLWGIQSQEISLCYWETRDDKQVVSTWTWKHHSTYHDLRVSVIPTFPKTVTVAVLQPCEHLNIRSHLYKHSVTVYLHTLCLCKGTAHTHSQILIMKAELHVGKTSDSDYHVQSNIYRRKTQCPEMK